jgi:hypothetical protein
VIKALKIKEEKLLCGRLRRKNLIKILKKNERRHEKEVRKEEEG